MSMSMIALGSSRFQFLLEYIYWVELHLIVGVLIANSGRWHGLS